MKAILSRVRHPSHPGRGHGSLTCHMTQFERSDWLRSENFTNIMIEYHIDSTIHGSFQNDNYWYQSIYRNSQIKWCLGQMIWHMLISILINACHTPKVFQKHTVYVIGYPPHKCPKISVCWLRVLWFSWNIFAIFGHFFYIRIIEKHIVWYDCYFHLVALFQIGTNTAVFYMQLTDTIISCITYSVSKNIFDKIADPSQVLIHFRKAQSPRRELIFWRLNIDRKLYKAWT